MIKEVECPNCKSMNNIKSLKCNNCQHLMRERIIGIDIWKLFWELLESPSNAMKKVFLAEHKNYLFVIFFIIALKISLLMLNIHSLVANVNYFDNIITNLLLNLAIFLLTVLSINLIIWRLYKFYKFGIKFKDLLAVTVYSYWLFIFSFIVLIPVEYALFGKYFFTNEFSPFVLKPGPAIILYILELIPLILSFAYLLLAYKTFITSRIKVISISLIVLTGTLLIVYLLSALINS